MGGVLGGERRQRVQMQNTGDPLLEEAPVRTG